MRVKTVNIDDEVRDVLSRATIESRALILNDPEIERTLYLRVDKVLKALGGKWNGRERCHQFPEGALNQLKAALDGSAPIVDQKKTLEQFFTPPELATRMAQMAGIGPGCHVLEPSAGSGRLVNAAFDEGAEFVTAVETDRVLLHRLDRIIRHRGGVFGADFTEWSPAARLLIDVALMNPPFSNNQDIRHVRRAFEFVRPGGRLVAIMSPHFTFAADRASIDFRAWLGTPGGIPKCGIGYANGGGPIESLQIEFLPAGTFKESGTDIAAVLVYIEKAE